MITKIYENANESDLDETYTSIRIVLNHYGKIVKENNGDFSENLNQLRIYEKSLQKYLNLLNKKKNRVLALEFIEIIPFVSKIKRNAENDENDKNRDKYFNKDRRIINPNKNDSTSDQLNKKLNKMVFVCVNLTKLFIVIQIKRLRKI